MRPGLWFVVPAYGRESLSAICLRQLRRTCDALDENGIDASAVVISDDDNLTTARELGFGTVRRDNQFLSAKFNDGIQAACDPRFNPRPVDFVVPCGSDDWVDYRIFLQGLPGPGTVLAFRRAAFVDETGTQIVSREISYEAGVGIRVYPSTMMGRRRRIGRDRRTNQLVFSPRYRPADEDRKSACDTSILVNVKKTYRGGAGPLIRYADLHEFQIVDWKSPTQQLNAWNEIVGRFSVGSPPADPFSTLRPIYPSEALDEMREHYGVREPVLA